MAQRDAGAGDPFWRQSAEVLIGHTLDLISAAQAVPSMVLANEIIQSGPLFADQVKDAQWRERSKCWELLDPRQGAERAAGTTYRQAETYWLREFPCCRKNPAKHRGDVHGGSGAPLLRRPCTRCLAATPASARTTFFDGKIVIVNLPVLDYHAAGRFASIVWKYCVQLALQRRADRQTPRVPFFGRGALLRPGLRPAFSNHGPERPLRHGIFDSEPEQLSCGVGGDAGRNRVDSCAPV